MTIDRLKILSNVLFTLVTLDSIYLSFMIVEYLLSVNNIFIYIPSFIIITSIIWLILIKLVSTLIIKPIYKKMHIL